MFREGGARGWGHTYTKIREGGVGRGEGGALAIKPIGTHIAVAFSTPG
jgi:hypothetical protein